MTINRNILNGSMVQGEWIIPNGHFSNNTAKPEWLDRLPQKVDKLDVKSIAENWSKLHDVYFDIVVLMSDGSAVAVKFNGKQKGLSDSFTKEQITEKLYDLVYG